MNEVFPQPDSPILANRLLLERKRPTYHHTAYFFEQGLRRTFVIQHRYLLNVNFPSWMAKLEIVSAWLAG